MSNDNVVFLILTSWCLVVNCQAQGDLSEPVASSIEKESDADYEDPHSFSRTLREQEYEDPHAFRKKSEGGTTTLVRKIGNYIGYDDVRGKSSNCDPCEEELRLCSMNNRNKPGNTDVADVLLSRRLVNTILSRAKLIEDGAVFSSHLKIELTRQELEQLREFGKGKLTLRQIDPILNNAIKTPTEDPVVKAFEFIAHAATVLYSTSLWVFVWTIENMEIVAAVPLALYILIVLNKKKYNLLMLLTVGVTVIFIISFVITWRKLIQEAEIKHSTLQMRYLDLPEHCRSDPTFWTRVQSFFRSSDDCKNYHAARMKTPFLDVTPAQALSHMLSHVVFEPVTVMGKAVAGFLQQVTADMSPFLAGIVQIAICVSLLPILIVCLILLAGGSLRLGAFGPLSFLSLSGGKRTNTESIKNVDSKMERQAVKIILKVESSERLARNLSIRNAENSETLSIANKTEKPKKKGEVKIVDDVSSAASSDSEDGFVEANEMSGSEVKRAPEVGSGDHV